MKQSRQTWFSTLVIAACFISSLWAQQGSKGPENDTNNLIQNPGFEDGFKKWYRGKGMIDSSEHHSGDCSCKIEIEDNNGDLDWFGGYTDPIKVEPNTRYKISAWICGKNVHGGKGATVLYTERDEDGKTLSNETISEEMYGTFPWIKVEKIIKTNVRTNTLVIGQQFKAYGAVWYDDFSLTRVTDE